MRRGGWITNIKATRFGHPCFIVEFPGRGMRCCSTQPVFSASFQREEYAIIISPASAVLFSSIACLYTTYPLSLKEHAHRTSLLAQATAVYWIAGVSKAHAYTPECSSHEIPATSITLTCNPHFAGWRHSVWERLQSEGVPSLLVLSIYPSHTEKSRWRKRLCARRSKRSESGLGGFDQVASTCWCLFVFHWPNSF